MRILLDQNMSRLLGSFLRNRGFDADDIRDHGLADATDQTVWKKAIELAAVLITRDFHFANPLRYDPAECGGIILVTPGDLKVANEIELVLKFLEERWNESLVGKLVLLSPDRIRVRES